METLNTIWQYVLPIGGGITVGTVIIFIISVIFKGMGQKIVDKVDVEKAEQKAVEAGIEKIKNISFTQSIEPIAKSQLMKIVEVVDDKVQEQLDKVNEGYENIVAILSKLAAYFDNSIAITESAKKELHDAIAEAQKLPVKEETVVPLIDDHAENETSADEEKTASAAIVR